MAQLGAGSRVRSQRGSVGIFDVGLVAKDQQGLAKIRNRLRLPGRLLPRDVLPVPLLMATRFCTRIGLRPGGRSTTVRRDKPTCAPDGRGFVALTPTSDGDTRGVLS